jgi:hypothetical protein
MTLRINNGDVNLMLTVLLGTTAPSKLIEPATTFIAGSLAFPGFMLSNQVLKQLLIGSSIGVGMAAGLHDMADTVLGDLMSLMRGIRVGHYLGLLLSSLPWSKVG